MPDLILDIFNAQSGVHGFRFVAEANTISADFCKSIGDGIRQRCVSIALDEQNCMVSLLGDSVSINFSKKPEEVQRISEILNGNVSIELYDDGEFSGCMVRGM